jgi:hypothetical protein
MIDAEIHFAPPAFAVAGGQYAASSRPRYSPNGPCYWLGAGCANLLASCLAIIPRSGEISGLANDSGR